MGPFIRNHHYNFIKKQTGIVQQALRTSADPKIVQTVRSSAVAKITEQFPELTEGQRELLEGLADARTADDFQTYLRTMEALVEVFPEVSEAGIRKLFPKNKKLKVPDVGAIDRRFVTYLGWHDIATGKMFMVCDYDGRIVGIEGKFTPSPKKSYCFVCNRVSEVGMFSAIAKSRPAKSSPDYYKAVGNYMCTDARACNQHVAETAQLERFIGSVVD